MTSAELRNASREAAELGIDAWARRARALIAKIKKESAERKSPE